MRSISRPATRHLAGFLLRGVALRLLITALLLLLTAPLAGQDGNLTQGCVEDFDPAVDYFPDKATLVNASGLEIEYHGHYKLLRTLQPWPGAESAVEYLLLQCGTPLPEGHEDALRVEVPVNSVISLSTTQLPNLLDLGQLDNLIAVDNGNYINTAEVVAMLQAGELAEVGNGASINVERVLELAPDLVLANGFNPETDAHPVLLEAGIFTAINADWLEPSLPARAEWLKFIAAFFNEEAAAEALYGQLMTEYDAAVALAAAVPEEERLTVLLNTFSPYSDAWIIPGQESWVGQLMRDAGVNYVLMDDVTGAVNQPFDFETVYEAGLEAPVWILNRFLMGSLEALLADDERYAEFAAYRNDAVYNTDARTNEQGGNDYWETGLARPHLLLRDLVKIFYPALLPEHDLMFHRKLS
ncbi:MAG: ABC transporter substrate-binding protein [Anaerolineaceae bacterium]|nr:ABC transporter substrate-binding protein [Anaerolineaceae bacterium]